jgi:hypothetical protein
MERSNTAKRKPPSMHDMFLAGVEFRSAAALQRQISDNPNTDPEIWWAMISGLSAKSVH